MFSVSQIRNSFADKRVIEDLASVRRTLATYRLRQEMLPDFSAKRRLSRLVDAVLVSAPSWKPGEGADLAERAAEAAEMLALTTRDFETTRFRLRSALLYELGALPMMAAAIVSDSDAPAFLVDFFKRRQAFSSLGAEIHLNGESEQVNLKNLLRVGACEDALNLLEYQHNPGATLAPNTQGLEEAARHLRLDFNLTEIKAFLEVVKRRAARTTRILTPVALLGDLRLIGFPPELWEAQVKALHAGLLNPVLDAWSLAAPTGTGKTFLARLLILDALERRPTAKILYIVPSKALVYQVSKDLKKSLEPKEVGVTAVTPQLVALDVEEDASVRDASVLVLTPEKADLLLRIGARFLKEVGLVVVDEAHHIEDGTRGVLLELYLARLLATLANTARYVLLSAVAPNIHELTQWMGKNPGGALVEQRSTRMKVGIYRIGREGRHNAGFIEYTDGTRIQLFGREVLTGKRAGLVQLAHSLGVAGPVLVVARGQGSAESIATDLCERIAVSSATGDLTQLQMESATMERLDSRLEREMYANVGLRKLVRSGVAYHHAGLPPRVREAVEDAIKQGFVRYVIATTTLAEGVNFPFSTVIVESLSIAAPTFETGKPMSYRIFTPRKFWNIAGRAGRPGFDHEGQVILYEPSLGLDKVKQTIDPYINPELRDIPAVTSALAEGLRGMRSATENGELNLADLETIEIPGNVPKSAQGIVNLLRVGLAHARATGFVGDPATYFDKTYAARVLPESELAFARRVVTQQQKVLDVYLSDPGAPSIRLVAELGLSIDTLSRLQRYVKELEDKQLEGLAHVLYGGRINFTRLPYLLSSVLSRMAELEGARLSGWYSTIVVDWCSGKPFSAIKPARANESLEDLIRLVYSRIQYMLPWGLYATDRFVIEETERRKLPYAGEVNQLAYLVDSGVPDMAALRLTSAGIERTDAARLSRIYFKSRDASETADILGWVRAQPDENLVRIVQGADRRRLDYDFFRLIREIRGTEEDSPDLEQP